MHKIVGLAIAIVGVALVISGLSAADTLSASASALYPGSPNNKSIWLMLGGVVLIGTGAVGIFHRPILTKHVGDAHRHSPWI